MGFVSSKLSVTIGHASVSSSFVIIMVLLVHVSGKKFVWTSAAVNSNNNDKHKHRLLIEC